MADFYQRAGFVKTLGVPCIFSSIFQAQKHRCDRAKSLHTMPELRRLDILFFEIGGNNTKGCEELPCFVTSAARSLCLSQTLAAQLTTVPFRLL